MTRSSSDAKVLNAIMEAAVDAIVVSDAAGTILRANPASHRLFGYGEGDLGGTNVKKLMPTWMAGTHDRFMADYMDTGEKKIIGLGREVTGLRKSGETFPLHISVGETLIDDAPVFVAILHDLTHRVASEKAMALSMRLDAIGQMTGGISHDFNNILTVIIGNLELAAMRDLDEKTAQHVKNAMDAAELGAGLTSRLMIFARKGALKPQVSDLGKVCRRTIDLLERTLDATHEITAEIPNDLTPVLVDPVQLESALVNLAVNARDAMPDGGKLLFQIEEIEIDDAYMARETDVKPGRYVRLLVSDNGEGMSPECQKRAFEPFFTTKADRSGTGLGLAMVYGFVRQSGGHITLYSEPGHGTSFGLYFPVVSGAAKPDHPAQLTDEDAGMPMGGGECILVVEDNAKMRQITQDRLRALDYRVEVVENADEAYRMLAQGAEIDLVFSDIVMPGTLNGFDLAARIQSEFPDVGVLLTSGYASDIVAPKAPSSVEFQLLHKPYHHRDLALRLALLLGRSSGSSRTTSQAKL